MPAGQKAGHCQDCHRLAHLQLDEVDTLSLDKLADLARVLIRDSASVLMKGDITSTAAYVAEQGPRQNGHLDIRILEHGCHGMTFTSGRLDSHLAIAGQIRA